MSPLNLLRRTVMAHAIRGGRLVFSRRNFSSYPDTYESEGPHGRLWRAVTGMSLGYVMGSLYLGFFGGNDKATETKELIKERREKVETIENSPGRYGVESIPFDPESKTVELLSPRCILGDKEKYIQTEQKYLETQQELTEAKEKIKELHKKYEDIATLEQSQAAYREEVQTELQEYDNIFEIMEMRNLEVAAALREKRRRREEASARRTVPTADSRPPEQRESRLDLNAEHNIIHS